jgi:ATP-dependent DNA helicase
LIHTLHAILKPFLLRRLKADVERDLPPKKEYILYAPLTVRQKEMYDVIVLGQFRQFLIDRGSEKVQKPVMDVNADPDEKRKLREGRKKYVDLDEDDNEWFRRIENPENDEGLGLDTQARDAMEIGRDYQYQTARECRVCIDAVG